MKSYGVEVEAEPESEVAEPLTDEPVGVPADLQDAVNQMRSADTTEADATAAKLRLNLMLSSFQSEMVDQDEYNLRFQEFQEKVVKAFKHLGLDTVKIFGR